MNGEKKKKKEKRKKGNWYLSVNFCFFFVLFETSTTLRKKDTKTVSPGLSNSGVQRTIQF